MADLDYQQIAKNLLGSLLDMARSETSAPKPTATPPATGIAPDPTAMFNLNKGANDFFKAITTELPQMVTGFLNVRDASNAAGKSISYVAEKISGIGGVFGKTAAAGLKLIDDYREMGNQANKIGIGQMDGFRLQEETQKAGFKNGQDYLDFLTKTAGNSLKTIDQTNDMSSRKFLDFATKLQSAPSSQQLKGMAGVSPEEISKIAAIAAGGNTKQLQTPEGQERLMNATTKMSLDIERMSSQTGKSREEIINAMLEYNKSARGQLELQAQGNDNQRNALRQAQVATAGLGQTMQNITTTIMSGGVLGKDQRTQLQVSTGGRAGQFMSAARDVRRTASLAEDDPQRKAAEKRMQAEVARANNYQNSQKFAQRALTTQDPNQKAAYERAQAENTQKFSQGAIQRETGLSAEDAARRGRELGGANLQGRTQEGIDRPVGAPGTMNEGARGAQMLNSVYESARMNAASASGELRKFNQDLGKTPEKIEAVRTTLERAFGNNKTQAESDARAAKLPKDFTTGITGTVDPKTASEVEASKGGAPKRGDRETRAHGTLGETGSPTEPKDIVAKLHKGETVATPEQLRNLMSNSASNAISEVMKSASAKPTGGIDISKITSGLREITTTISSVSGGGSTTRSTVENDDAKAAKKELETIKTQFQTEKNDLRTQVKGNLGADAKPVDIMRAMRDNPQAKALEARMQEATAKLSERIGAGTSINTKVETGINNTSIKDKTTENSSESITSKLASIKDNTIEDSSESITSKLASIKNKDETEQPEIAQPEIAQPEFEEQSDKIGLKDLNEQLVQLNTSIRQLIEHSAESVETAGKQVRATKGLSGNRFA
jgi:hypothetical protein